MSEQDNEQKIKTISFTLPDELLSVLDAVDIISMDIKPRSATGRDFAPMHARFMDIARAKDLYVKLVITDELTDTEFRQAANLLKCHAPAAIFFLQPVTPPPGVKSPTAGRLFALQDTALALGIDTRIVGQMHKILGVL